MESDIRNSKLASQGARRIEWAAREMPVLLRIRNRFRREKPLKGLRIGCCLHITTETANLLLTLKEGGAQVRACASNPLSTQDDVAASLVGDVGIPTFAVCGENSKRYYTHLQAVLRFKPHLTMDDGADLISEVHRQKKTFAGSVLGGTEETTTGVIRLRSLEKKGLLLYPVIAVNDAATKHLFDNRYGTGQSTIDGILRATNLLLAGKTVVVAGYGWCGRGVASRARGLGAHVVVTEINPVRALEALMDGFRVLSMREAAKIGDLFVTVTGNTGILRREHFLKMKDGAILANSGHFNVEIDLQALGRLSRKKRQMKELVEEYALRNGRRLYVLGQGRLVNLVCADGHPASVMDMSFANQALATEYLRHHGARLSKKVYEVPRGIDETIARLKLASMKVPIDSLNPAQRSYLASWELGT